MTGKPVLDACCGGRMMWFDKEDTRTIYMDNRRYVGTCCDGRSVSVDPDVLGDYADMPFPDASFRLVVLDPPHLRCGPNSWTAQKYGRLEGNWRETLRDYLVQIAQLLRDEGIVEGVPGKHGGYRLAKPAGEISVADIAFAVDCRVRDGRGAECAVVETRIVCVLSGMTLEEVAR